jgi:hypothetical protein
VVAAGISVKAPAHPVGDTCHWYVRLEPAAVTQNCAFVPVHTDWLVGWLVIAVAAFTVKIAPADEVVPHCVDALQR